MTAKLKDLLKIVGIVLVTMFLVYRVFPAKVKAIFLG